MGRKGHKRKNSHVVIVTSDAADGRMKQFRIRPWILQTLIIIACVFVGGVIGYFIYAEDIWAARQQRTALQDDAISTLEQEKAELEEQINALNAEIESLNGNVKILSETVAQKVQREDELSEKLEQQSLPTKFPLKGLATMEEVTEGDPICIFSSSSGSMVVATANGTVVVVNEDPEYGNNVWVDHGNGYTTIYRNRGEVKVKQGETVTQGATLMLITDDDSKLGYQMMKDGAYVDPMDMLDISG